MKRLFLVSTFALLCANATPRWETMSRAHKQARLNSIADACRIPRTYFKLRKGNELHFQPAPTASYRSVDCALSKLKRIPGYINLGFVGNEVVDPKVK